MEGEKKEGEMEKLTGFDFFLEIESDEQKQNCKRILFFDV